MRVRAKLGSAFCHFEILVPSRWRVGAYAQHRSHSPTEREETDRCGADGHGSGVLTEVHASPPCGQEQWGREVLW